MCCCKKKFNLENYIENVSNFPKEGIEFKDISPILENPKALKYVINQFASFVKKVKPDVIVGVESRGFIFGTPLALKTGLPFVLARKPNKLPRETNTVSYDLEYGTSSLQMHKGTIKPNQRVLIVDDLLATGGTVKATEELVKFDGGIVVGCCFVIELIDLKGKNKINSEICSLLKY